MMSAGSSNPPSGHPSSESHSGPGFSSFKGMSFDVIKKAKIWGARGKANVPPKEKAKEAKEAIRAEAFNMYMY